MIGKHLSVTEKSAWARVVSLCRHEKRWFVSSLLLTLGSTFLDIGALAIFGLAISLLVGDTGSLVGVAPQWIGEKLSGLSIAGENRSMFFILIAIAVLLQLIKSGMALGVIAVDAIFRANIQRRQVLTVSERILNAPLGVIQRYSVGSFTALGQQLNGYIRLCRVLQESTTCIVTMLIYFGASLVLNFGLALAIAAFTAVVFVVSRVIGARVKKNQTLVAQLEITLSKKMTEYYAASKMLQLYSATKIAVKEIHKLSSESIDRGTKIAIANGTMNPILEVLVVVLVAGLLASSAAKGLQNASALSPLFVMVLLFFRMKPYLTRLGAQKIKVANALPLASNVERFLLLSVDPKPVLKEAAEKEQVKQMASSIRLEGVSFAYDADSVVLKNIDLEVRRGEVVGLVGASGSGKSTVLSMLSGILEPQSGRIDVDGKDLRDIDIVSWRQHLGIVDPDLPLLNRSISENISFGDKEISEGKIREAAASAGASDFIEALPYGYDTVIGDRGEQLSFGQRQRLALARALARDPDLLILDEATSGLDPETEKGILDSVYQYRARGAVIFATHRLGSVIKSDRVYVIDAGRIVQSGSAKELLAIGGAFSTAWQASNLRTP